MDKPISSDNKKALRGIAKRPSRWLLVAAKLNIVGGSVLLISSHFYDLGANSGTGAILIVLGAFHHFHFHWLAPLAEELLLLRESEAGEGAEPPNKTMDLTLDPQVVIDS